MKVIHPGKHLRRSVATAKPKAVQIEIECPVPLEKAASSAKMERPGTFGEHPNCMCDDGATFSPNTKTCQNVRIGQNTGA